MYINYASLKNEEIKLGGTAIDFSPQWARGLFFYTQKSDLYKKIKEVKKMNNEINTSREQKNEIINQFEESYYEYLSNMKFNDSEEFEEDFSVAFMFL